ncbi:MAG: ABC transporter permease [Pseudomonadota bacterium]
MSIFTEILSFFSGSAPDLWPIVALSLHVSLSATLLAALLALPCGVLLAISRFWGRGAVLTIASAFMALPPVVVGLLVYLMLSRAGPLGNFGILFTPTAMIIAQTVLVFPIILSLTVDAVTPLHRSYKPLFSAYDAPKGLIIKSLVWDARFAITTAILAGFGRAIAEVGAVIIVGGNINGLTRVMTTTIALETSKGNLELALALGAVLILIALGVNAILHLIRRIGLRFEEAER